MLTQNEAEERAAKIWGEKPRQLSKLPISDLWSVELYGRIEDKILYHTLDANGHATCHSDCELAEMRAYGQQPIDKPDTDITVTPLVTEPSCGTCRFWKIVSNRDNDAGLCRRYPPKQYPVRKVWGGDYNQGFVTSFPETQRDDWCGEHQKS